MAQGVKANLSKQELEKLLEQYTLKEIAKQLNLSLTTVTRYKNKYNLQTNLNVARSRNSEKHTQYKCDSHYFDKIDTMNKAYLLGFLAADGFVTDRNEVGIGVATKDRSIVEFFKKELQSEKPIREDDVSCELRVQNKYLAETLKKYGIVPRKSLIIDLEKVIQAAQLNEEQISVFLLGYFDGDGCICLAHRKDNNKEYFEMNIVGTLETIKYFRNYFGYGSIN